MRKMVLALGAVGLGLAAAGSLWLTSKGQEPYTPSAIEGAYVHLAFEDTLETIGSARVAPQARDGDAVFAPGPTGYAYHAQGDGGHLEITTSDLAVLSEKVEISFDLKAEDWTNPYKKGAPIKTLAVVSGKSGDRIRHIVFNLSNGNEPILSVALQDKTGAKDKLKSSPGEVTMDWHHVRLVVDQTSETSELFLDGELVAKSEIVPSVVSDGVDRVRIGTWHRQNQAFRGLIDNFVIRDAAAGVS